MLMTTDRIKIMYSSILLTIKLKKTFKILKKYIIFFHEKIYVLTTVYYELLY